MQLMKLVIRVTNCLLDLIVNFHLGWNFLANKLVKLHFLSSCVLKNNA